jgi:DNA-binding LytR/AlgR family response regulator
VRAACSASDALLALDTEPVDVVFCDIKMPGLGGLDLARVLGRFAQPPLVVFVTAYDEHAGDAFDLRATDYVRKPVRPERLAEAVRRVVQAVGNGPEPGPEPEDETIAVELGGITRFVQRSQVRYVEAQGDYARLHTASSNHLVRIPLTTLEERWADAGFVRIHRSTLVALQHVDEIRIDAGRCSVRLGDRVLQVSRRHTRELRDRLVRAASLSAR